MPCALHQHGALRLLRLKIHPALQLTSQQYIRNVSRRSLSVPSTSLIQQHLQQPRSSQPKTLQSRFTSSKTPTEVFKGSEKLPSEPVLSSTNPPPSTRPPPLNLPIRDPSTPAYKHYFSLGKAYLSFYKTALKAIWSNYKTYHALLSRISSSPSSPSLNNHDAQRNPTPSSLSNITPKTLESALLTHSITRAEYLLCLRTRSDIARLPLFILIFCVCGEFTPLVVLFFSNAVPRTAWIPKQVEASRRKLDERRNRQGEDAVKEGEVGGLREKLLLRHGGEVIKDEEGVKAAARHLGMYAEFWDKYLGGLGGPPMGLIRRRYERWRREVEADDEVLRSLRTHSGSIEELQAEEVVMACEKRGIKVYGVEEPSLRVELEKWLQVGKRAHI